MTTPTILKKIIARKQEIITERKKQIPLEHLQKTIASLMSTRGFVAAMQRTLAADNPAIIAELKKASPSKGVIRKDFDPAAIAQQYEQAGATCLSVLTDVDFFQGSDEYLKLARQASLLPVIRKDFIVDDYQIYESRALEADCILLIAVCLSVGQLQDYSQIAGELGMDVLVEVHNEQELIDVLPLNTKLIGINNRDLHTFNTNLNTTFDLLDKIPDDRIIVTESGIHIHEDVKMMREKDVNGFLVGEAFMREEDPGQKLKDLFFEDGMSLI